MKINFLPATPVAVLCFILSSVSAQITIQFDTLPPVCSVDSLSCDGPVVYPFEINANDSQQLMVNHQLMLSDGSVVADTYGVLSGTYPDFEISGTYPIGQYHFVVQVLDGVGTDSFFMLPLEVVDCVAPQVHCVNGYAINLEPVEAGSDTNGDGMEDEGAVTVYVEDLLQEFSMDCSDSVTYSINIKGDPVDPNQDSLNLVCCLPSTLIVQIWAWDNVYNPYAGQPDGTIGGSNYDFCETYILLLDNLYSVCYCNDAGVSGISGVIQTEEGQGISGVYVQLSGDYSDAQLSDSYGGYDFYTYTSIGDDYAVTPSLNDNVSNGVTAHDLLLITQHILSVEPLDSPYAIIAADANYSNSISTRDLIQLRKVILGIYDEFPNNTSWRFINAKYVFPDPSNPWAELFPEEVLINNLPGEVNDADLIGVKIGDVNGSADPGQ